MPAFPPPDNDDVEDVKTWPGGGVAVQSVPVYPETQVQV